MAEQQAYIKNKILILNLTIYVKSLQITYRNLWRTMKKKCAVLCYG